MLVQFDHWVFTRRFADSGLSQKELASKARISERTVRDMCQGKRLRFRADVVAAVAKALGCPPSELSVASGGGAVSGASLIVEPSSGSALSGRSIAVRGVLGGVPDEHSVWLVVAKGALHWPKGPGLAVTKGKFDAQIFEGGELESSFDLLLWAVSPRGTEQICQWLRRGDEEDDYPGLDVVAGIVPLASVRNLSIRAPN